MHISTKQTPFHGHYFKLWLHFHNTTIRRTRERGSETYQPTTLPQPSPSETKCHNFPVIYPFIFTSLTPISLTHSLTLSLFLSISLFLAFKRVSTDSRTTQHVLLTVSPSRPSNFSHKWLLHPTIKNYVAGAAEGTELLRSSTYVCLPVHK